VTGSALPQPLRPRALRPADLVVIASLSGPLHAAYEPDLEQAVVVLERMGFRVRRAPLLEAGRHHWWSAATPAEIAREFNALLRDPEVRAIIAHDGGQTALGYLDLIDVEAIAADPKPILGYSDISLLHLVLYARTGLVGFHADLATPGLGGAWRAAPAARRAELEKLYSTLLTGTEAIGALPATPSWECWRAGRVEGRLIGGVLNRIMRAQATRFALRRIRPAPALRRRPGRRSRAPAQRRRCWRSAGRRSKSPSSPTSGTTARGCGSRRLVKKTRHPKIDTRHRTPHCGQGDLKLRLIGAFE
jgi:muramoyltetrapeptide carboxypeptidase